MAVTFAVCIYGERSDTDSFREIRQIRESFQFFFGAFSMVFDVVLDYFIKTVE